MPATSPALTLADPQRRMLVVDTNVVLDLWVFLDPGAGKVAAATQSPSWCWIGSQPMRDELALVLDYPHIAARLERNGRTRLQVLVQYDALVLQLETAPRASAICKDPDDQKFIDLAAQHGAVLVSKDKAVLALNKRLNKLGAVALTAAAFGI